MTNFCQKKCKTYKWLGHSLSSCVFSIHYSHYMCSSKIIMHDIITYQTSLSIFTSASNKHYLTTIYIYLSTIGLCCPVKGNKSGIATSTQTHLIFFSPTTTTTTTIYNNIINHHDVVMQQESDRKIREVLLIREGLMIGGFILIPSDNLHHKK